MHSVSKSSKTAQLMHAGAMIAVACSQAVVAFAEGPFAQPEKPIILLQPFGDQAELHSEPGIQIFFTYFNSAWPWVVGTAAGVAVLQALIGGVQIMMSGSDSGARGEGKNRLLWALAGLLLIGLSGMILESINPLFYRQG